MSGGKSVTDLTVTERLAILHLEMSGLYARIGQYEEEDRRREADQFRDSIFAHQAATPSERLEQARKRFDAAATALTAAEARYAEHKKEEGE
jgi:multidrug resistance efflux pump